ncbi:LysM peptidoglycan-binding domain-containing protein [Neisseria chenwenguii]|uniref:Lytic transglycosylase n=1 Tax=Neisseria chenwenguii TaxID=1853278 RepID=A0A220S3N2_9NEIS|nr:LysM peptidoglycan-binding domain-containing protein [Neisseria chenwenguii]ASK28084.1 lytic transglycosylase [Neisseria chenwenguii]ROV57235.1 LysM peptidoglycan-binding domain-containing protein [Neisseria chenwenguii]
MAKLKTIALTVSGLSAISGAAHAQNSNATPNQIGMSMMRLNSALLDQAKSQVFGSGSLWANLRKDFRIGEVNAELVRRHESKFSANSAYFDRTINRSKPYMYHIANEVKKRNMPAEIALLPFIESAFVTKAKSHVGASGLWQFMPSTGRHYGLEKSALYDGRHDVYAATDAALNYLQYLHGMFGDWSLALAAYNWGEGNVGRAVNRARAQGLEPTYENLRMPDETRNYVPKLLAVRNIVSSPQSFGMHISDIGNRPYFKAVSVDRPIDNSVIARLANISESEFLALNPAFNAPVFIPKNNRKLLLPADSVATFEKNYRSANPDSLLSWDVYKSYGNTGLNTVASETNMSVSEIKRLNGISSNTLSAGRNILVSKNSIPAGSVAQNAANVSDISYTPDSYRASKPEYAPVQVAKAVKVDAAKQFVKVDIPVVAEVSPRFVAPVDFINRTKSAATVTVQADAQAKSAQVASASPAVVSTVVEAPVSEIAKAETESKPISLASSLVKNDAKPASAVATTVNAAPVQSAQNSQAVTTVAVSEPLPLPTKVDHGGNVAETAEDSLMALVEKSSVRFDDGAAQTANQQVAVASEAAAQARTVRIAENRVKQQKRLNSRLARAGGQSGGSEQVASGMHRVADGDTLFNISKRYNLSVADLITANNIKGNNIRKGQLLKVSASAPNKAKQSNIRNVSYTVRKGDTLNTISSRFNVDINDIRRWNRNTRTVNPGQRLKLMGS